jgi:RecB family endonuclease NucS
MTKAKWEIIEEYVNRDAAAAVVEQIDLIQRNLTVMRNCVDQQNGIVDIHAAAKLFNDTHNSMIILNSLLCKFL